MRAVNSVQLEPDGTVLKGLVNFLLVASHFRMVVKPGVFRFAKAGAKAT